MEPRPDITPANLVTAAIALVVVLVAVAVVILMPSGVGNISDMEYAVWEVALGPGSAECILVVDPETLVLDEEGELDGIDPARVVKGYLSADDIDPELAAPLREALADLLQKSRAPWPTEPRFSPEMFARVMTREDRREIFGEYDGCWQRLYRRFAGGRDHGAAYVSLSRVGFSRHGIYALVYWGSQSGGKSGWGGLALLRWAGTKWEKVKSLVTWVS